MSNRRQRLYQDHYQYKFNEHHVRHSIPKFDSNGDQLKLTTADDVRLTAQQTPGAILAAQIMFFLMVAVYLIGRLSIQMMVKLVKFLVNQCQKDRFQISKNNVETKRILKNKRN